MFDNSSLNNAVVSGLSQGVNLLSWTVKKNGCQGSSNVTITNNTVTASASSQTVCSSGATLNGNQPVGGASGYWSKIGNNPSIISNSLLYNSVVSNLSGVILKHWRS